MRRAFFLALGLAAALLAGGNQTLDAQQTTTDAKPIRIGLIGLDSSHSGAFTQLLNDPSRADHIPGARIVAAFKAGHKGGRSRFPIVEVQGRSNAPALGQID